MAHTGRSESTSYSQGTPVLSAELTFDAEVDGVAGGLALAVLRPAGVGPVVFLLHPLQLRVAVIDILSF